MLYIIGSLRNPSLPGIAEQLRAEGLDVFDDWFAAGKHADDAWRDYETSRGFDYSVALKRHPAQHTFRFDQFHLNRAHGAVIVMPSGKSAHLEAGTLCGQGKPVWMLLENGAAPPRFDVMTAFLQGVCKNVDQLAHSIRSFQWPKLPAMPAVLFEDALWLAGLLEGEGSFCLTGKVPRLVLQMTDQDVIARAAGILGSQVWTNGRKTKGDKTVWGCGRSGLHGVEWMRVLRPYMGARRQRQILNTVQGWLVNRTYNRRDELVWRQWFGLQA